MAEVHPETRTLIDGKRVGSRQNGIAGFDQYLEIKSLAWPKA